MAPSKKRQSHYSLRPRRTKQSSEIKKKNCLTSSESMPSHRRIRHHRMQKTCAKSPKTPQGSSSSENIEYESSYVRVVDEDCSIRKFDDEFSTSDTDSESNDVECTICLDTVTDDYRMEEINACKHHFHKSCLQNWMRENKICPVCRTIVPIYIFSDSESETKSSNEEKPEVNGDSARSPMPLSESALNYAYMQVIDNLDNYRHGRFTTEYVLY